MESRRLILRPLEAQDAEAVFGYRGLHEVARYQYWEPFTLRQAEGFVDRYAGQPLRGDGEWESAAIIEKQSGTLIGDCALKADGTTAEIGCNIHPVYQGRGFASEALGILMEYCIATLGIQQIAGITDVQNTASVKLMESLGMSRDPGFENKLMCKGLSCTEHRYTITKEMWQ